MSKIRVLIVDDSSVVRRFLTDAISQDPALEVVGTASHGALAVRKVALLAPQVVTMDIEMPEMSGLEALAAIRLTNPDLPIIMVSSLTEHGAVATLEALSLGATDYVTKPSSMTGLGASQKEEFTRDLLARIVALGSRGAARARPAAGSVGAAVAPVVQLPPRLVPSTVARPAARVEVVAIGVSTGGPNALAELLPALPVELGVPILIVQHMPPLFTRLLAERLNSRSALTVKEGAAGDRIEAGTVYLAPGNHHMVVERSKSGGYVLGLNQREAENSCRPSVDVLFRSVGDCFGRAALAVIMTGMGQDGLRGCELIRERGGQVLAQDEKSSVVWGMPGYVVEAGLADQVLPLDRLAAAIVRQVNGAGSASGSGLARNPAESWSQRKVGLT